MLKGTMGFLAALALALCMLPAANAGIPVPSAAVLGIAQEGIATAAAVTDAFGDDATAIGRELEMANVRTLAAIGDAVTNEGNGELYIPLGETFNAAEVASDSVLTSFGVGVDYGADSAITGLAATGVVSEGTQASANNGVDSGKAFALRTEAAADAQAQQAGYSTQSVAQSANGFQAVVVQGSLNTYKQHAAPAACTVAGIAANASGSFSAQDTCETLL